MDEDRPFLIVEDDDLWLRRLRSRLERHGPTEAAGSVHEALAMLASRRDWRGFVIDVRLPDGSGLDVLSVARRRHPETPAIVVTALPDPEVARQALLLDAFYLPKGDPGYSQGLDSWAARACEPSSVEERIQAVLDALEGNDRLTPSQEQVLRLATEELSPEEIAGKLKVKLSTVHSHSRAIIARTRARSLLDAAVKIMRRALS
jgi:DNA-binding NarL/FixJ family response regulator